MIPFNLALFFSIWIPEHSINYTQQAHSAIHKSNGLALANPFNLRRKLRRYKIIQQTENAF